MPTYRFRLSLPPDPEPQEFKDGDEAWRTAVILMGETVRDHDGRLKPRQTLSVEVVGEGERPVLSRSLEATHRE
ncbi:DUF6894 family protein [Flaviflagellibacter deserti]|uniref:DUF6894 family protein n=1 Tax=Flaviflagellibacter deserti TaxID=2267266 RepID=A0ABV9Z0L4_9HYPH